MRASTTACAFTIVFMAVAQAQTGAPGGYVRTPGGFMVPAPGSPQAPYVANPPNYPYIRPAPGYPNINAPSLRQQYYMYGYPPRGR